MPGTHTANVLDRLAWSADIAPDLFSCAWAMMHEERTDDWSVQNAGRQPQESACPASQ